MEGQLIGAPFVNMHSICVENSRQFRIVSEFYISLKTSSSGRWLMIMEKRYYVSFTVSKSPYHCISMTWWLRTSTKTNPVGTNIPFVFSFTAITTVGRCSEIALNFRVQMFLAQFLICWGKFTCYINCWRGAIRCFFRFHRFLDCVYFSKISVYSHWLHLFALSLH